MTGAVPVFTITDRYLTAEARAGERAQTVSHSSSRANIAIKYPSVV